jgi:hypothetical protein
MIVSGIPEASNGSEEEKAAHDKTSVEALLTALETPWYEMKRFKRIKTNFGVQSQPELNTLYEFRVVNGTDVKASEILG